jgi:hypothetical protein
MSGKKIAIAAILLLAAFLFLYEGVWRWGLSRTYVPPGYSLQLTSMTGGPAGADAYATPGQQGVQQQMLGPGRHFLAPWEYSTKLVKDFEVPPGRIALVRNNIGADLPPGRFLAGPNEKGTQLTVLTPGVWRLNQFGQIPYVQPEFSKSGGGQTQPMVYIPPGYVGVQTFAEGANKGISQKVLQAGYYDLNPEQVKVTVVGIGYDVQEMAVDYEERQVKDATGKTSRQMVPREGTGVNFPLADGKQMYLDMTVVWGISPADAPRIVQDYGTEEMLEQKVIIPQILSICKNAGSDLTTKDFIAGNTRDQFQERVTQELQAMGKEKGIHFLIALVKGFHPDPEITATIQARMLAEEEIITLSTEQARDTVAGELEGAKRKVATALKDFDSETTALVAKQKEEGLKEAAMAKATADRQVAALNRQVAELDAKGVQIDGKAEADVLERTGTAEAELMKLLVTAYGGPDAFNLATFAKNLPEDLHVEYHYAGPGTLWTDQSIQDVAARKVISSAPPANAPK